ncbi:hypothetical protein MY3296_000602 [Beauveria thailandica]
MDAIRLLAQANFAEYDRFQKRHFHQVDSSVLMDQASITAASKRFQESTSSDQMKPQLLTIKAAIGEDSCFLLREIDDEYILKHLNLPDDGQAPGASLSLIVVPYNTQNWSFEISKTTFLRIFELCALDPAALDLIRFPAWGMHVFRQSTDAVTYYLGSVLSIICWSFDPKTVTTRGVMIPRSTFDTGHARDTLARFVRLLSLQKDHIYTPHTLTFTQLVDLVSTIQELMSSDLTKLAQIERMTGHGLWTRSLEGSAEESDPAHELTWLKEASKIIGNKLINNSRYTYLLDIAEASIRDIKFDETMEENMHRQNDQEQQQHKQYRLDTNYRMEAVQNLERRVARLKPSLLYNLSRFNSQSMVVSFDSAYMYPQVC